MTTDQPTEKKNTAVLIKSLLKYVENRFSIYDAHNTKPKPNNIDAVLAFSKQKFSHVYALRTLLLLLWFNVFIFISIIKYLLGN